MKKNWAAACAAATLLLLSGAAAAQPPALAHLTRGVNVSNWLQHGRPQDAFAPDADDFRRMRALGLDHVRIPFDPAALVDDRAQPRVAAVSGLKKTIVEANKAGLLVVLALQLPAESKAGLVDREIDRLALAGTWRWVAYALRDLPPGKLAFEPLNEPEMADARLSRLLLGYLVAELRKVVPKHTLIVSGHRYAGVAELEAMQPLPDANLVYSFHFYEPHNFTHQGADWGDPRWKFLRDFPYPSSPEAVERWADAVPASSRELLAWHGEERWNRARIAGIIDRAAKWAKRHRVPVICGEFGVLKQNVAAVDRAAWLADVRAALEERRIGWTHWDYNGPFGLVEGRRGDRVVDEKAVTALGLSGK